MRSSKTSPTSSGVARPSLPLQKIRDLNQEAGGKISFTDVINACPQNVTFTQSNAFYSLLLSSLDDHHKGTFIQIKIKIL